MEKTDNKISEIKGKIKKLDRKIKIIVLLKKTLLFVSLTGLVLIFISLLESAGFHSSSDRKVLFMIGLSSEIFFSILFLISPLFRLFSPLSDKEFYSLAKFVGDNIDEIKDKLLNALQLYKEKNGGNNGLKEAAILSNLQSSDKYEFSRLIGFKILKPVSLFTALILAVVLSLFTFGNLQKSFGRIINYNLEYIIPQRILFAISPGNIEATSGSEVRIAATLSGDKPAMVFLLMKNREDKAYSQRQLFPDSLNTYLYIIRKINSTTEYYFKADEIESRRYKIDVIERPIITNIGLTISPPVYSNLSKRLQKENGNVTALRGSTIELNLTASKNLTNATIVFSDSTSKAVTVKGKNGYAKINVKRSIGYFISITDSNGNKNIHPIEYSIDILKDEFPEINILEPTDDVVLNKSEIIPTTIKVSDDYGFSELLLMHKLVNTTFGVPEKEYVHEKIPLKKGELSQTIIYNWLLSSRMLTAGDVLSFYFEVWDNDNINGPKSVKSELFYLRVPSMDELLTKADSEQEEVKFNLEETLKEAEKLKEDMKELSNKLKKDEKKITWDEKKKIEETAKRLEKLQEKIKTAQENIERTKKSLEENNLLSKETLEKYSELQKLMDEMNSEEMKRAMKIMQEQLKSMNRDKAQQSLEQMEFNEEMFKKSIERTVNLLKRIRIEQKTDEIIKRTEALGKKSEELKKEINKSNLNNKSEKELLKKRKEEIDNELKRLKEEMKKLQEKMNDFKDMPNDLMQELQDEMDMQNNEKLTEMTEQMISQNMKSGAMEQMDNFSQNMRNMKSRMEQMQEQMQQQNQMKVLFEMMKNIENLLMLSEDEEKLKNEMENSNRGSDELLRKMQQQKEISDGLNKTLNGLSELSQKTFAVTPEMGRALGSASREMNSAMQAMQNGNGSLAVLSQKGAMKYLNEAATMMKGNMEQMMNGGQGGGMMTMMQQMQQMSQQQMGINQLTRQMQQGKLTMQQQAQMKRLQQQQEVIRKSLEQLNKESKERGDSKKLAANLEEILEEMKEVITKMNSEKIDDDLIKSQEKILSKLLDAQRSINERDYEKNRESKSSKNFSRKSPEQINIEKEKNRIKDELMKLIDEGYSKDYEDLIRRYYNILEKEKEHEISE